MRDKSFDDFKQDETIGPGRDTYSDLRKRPLLDRISYLLAADQAVLKPDETLAWLEGGPQVPRLVTELGLSIEDFDPETKRDSIERLKRIMANAGGGGRIFVSGITGGKKGPGPNSAGHADFRPRN